MIDRLLGRLASRSLRRGLAGEPLWLALGVVVWLVRRERRRGPSVVWRGRLEPGQQLEVRSWVPGEGQPAPPLA